MNIQNLIGMTTGANRVAFAPQTSALEETTDSIVKAKTDSFTALNETSTDQSKTAEEFETFLTLLTAQIKNQDPLAPLDSTQFVQQLATFSGLELQAESNQKLDQIAFLLAQQMGDE